MCMSIFKEYIDYLKDNPEGYWFKRKLYGWGWTPARWQGWAVVVVYIVALLAVLLPLEGQVLTTDEIIRRAVAPVIILTLVLIVVSYYKGESPRWQWGRRKNNE